MKEINFSASADSLISLSARPNYKVLGPRFSKETELAATSIRDLPEVDLQAYRAGEEISIEVAGRILPLQVGDLEVQEVSREGLVVRSESGLTVALDPTIDDDLREEGLARELVNRIQRLRKDSDLEITDRIRLGVFGPKEIQTAAGRHRSFICGETLAVQIKIGGDEEGAYVYNFVESFRIDELDVVLMLQREVVAEGQGS